MSVNVRFMSWNVAMGPTHGTSLDAVADLINQENPDIVCMQEMTRPYVDYVISRLYALGWHTRGLNTNAISYTWVITISSLDFGNAVMGRVPITFGDAVFLPSDGSSEARAILRANAAIPGLGTVWVYSTHVSPSGGTSQLGAALNWAKSGLPGAPRRVVCGDFNYDNDRDEMKATWLNPPGPPQPDTPWVSPFTPALSGDSFPGNAPTAWIDYAFVVSPTVSVTAAGVRTNKVSDHGAVLVNTTIA